MASAPDPSKIMQVGSGFWPSKVLLVAVEFGLFTRLADGPLTGRELEGALDLHPRGTFDFLDALVALGFLEREGDGEQGRYSNAADTDLYLDRGKPQYIGGILEMFNARLFRYWADLTDALKTGEPQNEVKHTGKPMFDELYADPARLEQFMGAMTGISLGNFRALADKFDFSAFQTLCDVGGATGQLSLIVAGRHPHLRCTSFDLPVVEPIAKKTIAAAGLAERVATASGD